MTTLASNTAIGLQYDYTNTDTFLFARDQFFSITWQGDVADFSFTETGGSVKGLPEIAFDTPALHVKGTGTFIMPPADWQLAAADLSWVDGGARSATVFAMYSASEDVLVFTRIAGDILPTAADDVAGWFAGLTIASASGAFAPGAPIAASGGFVGELFVTENDYIAGTPGDETLFGGSGADFMVASAGRDHLDGGSTSAVLNLIGAVNLSSDPGAVVSGKRGLLTWDHGRTSFENITEIRGTDWADRLIGWDNDSRILGGAGNDRIRSFDGFDFLRGGDDDDLIDSGGGDDTVRGDSGNDIIRSGAGDDFVLGGDGDDVVRAGAGNDTIQGDDPFNSGADRLFGNGGDDMIQGWAGDDRLYGGRGSDTLEGGDGDDALRGEAGQDRLEGGRGDDNLYGGENADVFVFTDEVIGRDRIKDFEDGLDLLDLSRFFWSEAEFLAALSQQAGGVRVDFGDLEGAARNVLIEGAVLADITADDVIGLIG